MYGIVPSNCLGGTRRFHVILIVLLTALSHPSDVALAHGGTLTGAHDLWNAWSLEPLALTTLAASALVYANGLSKLWRRAGVGHGIRRWQAAAFAGGLVSLFIGLVSPLNTLAAMLFSAHMVQHLVLVVVAAPLLVLGWPLLPVLWALPPSHRRRLGLWWRHARSPRTAWRVLTQPMLVLAMHTVVVWVWHLPDLYLAALANDFVHATEHASFLGTGLLFWWSVLHPATRSRFGYGSGILYLFAAAMQGGALGALLTFSREPWYPTYTVRASVWGLTALEDQQAAGLIMWVPGGLVYLVAALILFAAWLRAVERRVQLNAPLAQVTQDRCPRREDPIILPKSRRRLP